MPLSTQTHGNTNAFRHLPLLCALLIAAHIEFLTQTKLTELGFVHYGLIIVQLALLSVPLFVIHQLVDKLKKPKNLLVWFAGFIAYPLFIFSLAAVFPEMNILSRFTADTAAIFAIASTAWFINRALVAQDHQGVSRFFSRLFSLDAVVFLLLLCWALVMAGIGVSEQNGENPIVDLGEVVTKFSTFIFFCWQYLLIAAVVAGIYAINRYLLVRQLLAKHGVVMFVSAQVILIIVLTPMIASLLLNLPLNADKVVFFPSDNHHIFAASNYQYLFIIMALSTPLILVFERQQHEKALAQVAQNQVETELKLLQQQINPHFLFNTLNNLYALTLKKADDAPRLVTRLSNLLRFVVYEGQKPLVPLTKEIDYLQDYIALQQIRCNHKCTINTQWPSEAEHLAITPLLIIMLLENAFNHGIENTNEQSTINFSMQLAQHSLIVKCENTFIYNKQNKTGGMGLKNLRRRLALLYPERHSLVSHAKDQIWYAELRLELIPC